MSQVLRDIASLRAAVRGWHKAGEVVGLVPTMGALHAGHLSLVRAAQADCARVIVTIFVNPKQFNSAADLANYPRTEEADLALLRAAGADVLFAPPPNVVYPEGFATLVSVAGVARALEGASRPGHFDGVATVVTKLFGMSGADRAYFGEKDWQQLQVVRRFSADLNLAVEIIGCATLREADGLAMSSRNVRLRPRARAIAPALHIAMQNAAAALRSGDISALERCKADVLQAGFDSIDYIELRCAQTLVEISAPPPVAARLLAAAWIDGVRLIDNIPV